MDESQKENFNHLKIHSQYSICEGAIKIDELKDYTKENKIKAIALCDSENLCGALEFAEKLSKVGTQPIIGSQINFKINDTIGLLPLFACLTSFLNCLFNLLVSFLTSFLICFLIFGATFSAFGGVLTTTGAV